MAHIYKIVNDINDKIYVGKTEGSIVERWKQHCSDYKKRECENRPLYRAMKKYGIEHFHIELIEDTDKPEEREIYWIEQMRSFKYGYNATLGGDGKRYIDYDVVISAYQELQSIKAVSNLLGHQPETISRILKENSIPIKTSQQITKEKYGKPVKMFDLKTGELLQVFPNLADAGRYLQNKGFTQAQDLYGISAHVGKCASGLRKKAYGFLWKW